MIILNRFKGLIYIIEIVMFCLAGVDLMFAFIRNHYCKRCAVYITHNFVFKRRCTTFHHSLLKRFLRHIYDQGNRRKSYFTTSSK